MEEDSDCMENNNSWYEKTIVFLLKSGCYESDCNERK